MRQSSHINNPIRLGFFLICIMMTLVSHSQFPTYYVHLVKGECFLKKPDKKRVLLKQKDLIYNDNTIEIKKDNTEVHLVDKDGHFLIVNKKGAYTAADLTKIPIKKTQGVTQKYLHFLWEDLFRPDLNKKIMNEENLAGSWGGVNRGGSDCNLTLFPADGEFISSDTLKFRWKQAEPGLDYQFVLQDELGKEIMNFIFRDSTLTTLTTYLKNDQKTIYFLSIKPVKQVCNSRPKTRFYLLTQAEEKKIIDSLIKDISHYDPVLYDLEVADALGSNGFITEAKKYLSKVLSRPGFD